MSAKKIGITGGIGSGKTTVCHIFETLGIPVYYADERAKWLMINNLELVSGIKNLFGEAAYDLQGELNRLHISQLAFNDPTKLAQLNALVHPAVLLDGAQWHQSQENVPYTLKEAALIYESGSYQQLDKVIVVTAPIALRIERVMQRDGVTQAAVEARLKQQMPEAEKIKRADFVIYNDGSQTLIPQVLAIHKDLVSNK